MIDICRLCLEEISQIYNSSDDNENISPNEKLRFVIPEIDISITRTLTLCNKCIQSLNISYTFKNACIQVEKVIKEYMKCMETQILDLELIRNYKYCETSANKEIKIEVDNAASNEVQFITDIENDTGVTFYCDKCNKYFDDIEIFKSHCDSCVLYRCIQCAETFLSEEDFENHQKVHMISEHFPSNLCNKSFSKDSQLQEHSSKYHADVKLVIFCEFCNKSFLCKRYLERHVYRQHKNHKRHSCDKCDQSYYSKANLMHHKESHMENNYDCINCNKSFNSLHNLQRHMKNTHYATHICDTCGTRCASKYALKQHTRIHTGEKPYNCDVCGKGFSQQSTLGIHMRCTHSSERPFICKICGKTFNLRSTLRLHGVIHIENLERTFMCSECPKTFKTNKSLRQHIRRHTAERKFICTVCTKSFLESNDLKKHMRAHTGEQPYECHTCHKRFSQKYNLQIHFRSHKPNTKIGKKQSIQE